MKFIWLFSFIFISINLFAQPSSPNEPTGNGQYCKDLPTTFYIDSVPGAVTYEWTFLPGFAVTSPSNLITNDTTLEVTWNTTWGGTGVMVSVIACDSLGVCSSNSPIFSVTLGMTPTAGFSVPADTICSGTPIVFTNSSSNALTYNWNYGDGTSSGGINPHHLYNTFGTGNVQTYDVQLIAMNGSCVDTITESVYIREKPSLTLEDANNNTWQDCNYMGSSELIVLNSDSTLNNITSYSINWGDGIIDSQASNLSSISHTYFNDSTFTINVTATNAGGCSITKSAFYAIGGSVYVGVSGNYTNYCAPHTHEFLITNYTSNSSGTIYKVWFGDGIVVPPLTPQTQDAVLYNLASDDTIAQHELDLLGGVITHYYGNNSCDYYKFWVMVDNICDYRSQASPVFQITRPIDNEYEIDTLACVDEPITMTIQNMDSCYLIDEVNYIINWGDNTTEPYTSTSNSPLESVNHIYNTVGTFQIVVDAITSGSCDTVLVTDTVLVCIETAPIPDFDPGIVYCVGDTVLIDNQTDDSFCSGPPDYTWNISPAGNWIFAPGSNDTVVNPQIIFLAPGDYDITLTSTSCNSEEGTETIQIIDVPDIDITQGNMTYCGEQTLDINTVYFDNGDPITNYLWGLPPGVTVVAPSSINDSIPGLNFPMLSTSTDYAVTVTATNVCGDESEEVVITVNPVPEMSFSITSNNMIDSVCSGDSINYEFISNLPNTEFYWEATIDPIGSVSGLSSSGSTDINTTLYNIGVTSGTITIIAYPILTDNNYTCNGISDTIIIDVHPLPDVNIYQDLIFCANDPYDTLTSSINGGIWTGTGIINGSLGVFNPGVNPSGSYNINYAYTNPQTGCFDDDDLLITVNSIPVVFAGNDTILCNQSVSEQLSGFSPPGGVWSGAGILNPNIAEFTPSGIGLYNILYSYTNSNGCTTTDNLSINVIGLTEANAGQDTAVCVNVNSITLDGLPVNGNWSGSGINSGGVYSISTSGDFEVYYSIGAGTCYDEDTLVVTVDPLPNVDIGPDLFYCITDAYDTLQSNSSGGTWSGQGIINSGLGVFNPGFNNPGTYNVSYTYIEPITGCSNFDNIVLTVYDLPIVSAGFDTSYCNQSIAETLENYSPIGGSWSGAGITNSIGEFTPDSLGFFDVYYNYTDIHGCINEDTLNIEVVDVTIANAGLDTSVCENLTSISLTGVPSSGVWSGVGMNSIGIYAVVNPGNFEVYYGIGSGSCYDEDTVVINVDALPIVDAGPDLFYCITDGFDTLTSNVSGGQWIGYGIIDQALGVFNPAINIAAVYSATYTYTESITGCTNSDEVQLTVYDQPIVNAGSDTILCNQLVSELLGGYSPFGGYWSGIGITDSVAGEFTPGGTGIYELYYDYTDLNGCSNRDTVSVNVIALTEAIAGQDTAVCESETLLSLSGSPINGNWFGSGISSNGQYTIGTPGNFEIYYSIGSGTCYDEDTVIVTIDALPFVDIGPDLFYCISDNNDTLISNQSGGQWSGYGILDQSLGIFSPAIDTAGIYSISYSYTELSTGCENSDQVLLTVYDLPTVNAGTDTILCDQSVAEQLVGFSPPGGNWSGTGITNSALGEFTPNGIGIYDVYYDYTDINGCYNQDTLSINIIGLTDANAGQDTSVCEDIAIVALSGFPSNGNWTGIGITNNGNYSVVNPGNYELYYSIGVGSCFDKDTIVLTINALPTVDIGPDLYYCISDEYDTLSSNLNGGLWAGYGIINSPDGVFNPGIDTAGIYSISYSYTELSTGCENSDNILLTVYDLPFVDAGQDTTLCNQSTAEQLLGFSPSGGSWSGTGISNSTVGLYTPNGLGSFDVYYNFIDINGCANQDTLNLNVINVTDAIAGDDAIICEDVPLASFSGIPANGNWSGNGISNNGEYTVTSDGIFEFYYSIGSGSCYDEDTVQLTINPLPIVNVGSDLVYCISDLNDTLFSNVTGGQWDGSGIIDVNTGIYDPGSFGSGNFEISYFYTNPANSCSNTDTLTVTVYELPVVNAGNDTVFCNQSFAQLLSGNSPAGGTWSGTGITNTLLGEFTPNGVSVYEVYYSYIDTNGCFNSDTLEVEVIELTEADAGLDSAICEDITSITLAATPLNGNWSGNGIDNFGTYQINQPGSFEFYYSFGTGTCYDKDTVVVTVNPLPVITIDPDFNICIDADSLDLSESPSGGIWSGSGITNTQDGVFDPLIASVGTHLLEYSYTIAATGCSDIAQISAYVRPKPISDFNIDSPICRLSVIPPNNLSIGATTYNWFFNNNQFSTQFEPGISFPDTGIVNLMLISNTQYGCDDTSYASTYIIDVPSPAFTFTPRFGCEPLEVGFYNQSTGDIDDSYWVFGNGIESIDHSPGHLIYTLTGPTEQYFIITLNESNECGDATIIDSVLIYSVPEVDFNELEPEGCVPYDLDLSGIYIDVPLGGVWNFGDGTTSNFLDPSHLYSTPGVYNINITVDGPPNCLQNGDTTFQQTITVYENPTVTYIPESNFICEDDSSLIELDGAYSYSITGNGFTQITNSEFIFLAPDENTTYSIIGMDINGCEDDTSINIIVEQIPIFDLGRDTCMQKDEYVILNTGVSSDDYIINWSTGENTPEIAAYGSHSDYCVEVIPQRCPMVLECVSVDYCPKAALPNAFSPNGDHNNDVLFVEGNHIKDMHLQIFNRQGIKVFDTRSKSTGWYGSFQGEEQPMDVYVYSLWVRFTDKTEITKQGNITLLR